MPYDSILYEKFDNIIRIMMNRPGKRNAQDFHMFDELTDAFRQADLDEEARVVIFGGVGDSFSSGHDMSGRGQPSEAPEMQTKRRGLEGRLAREQHIFFNQAMGIRNCRHPVIAQVQGYCLAGGLMVASACDIIYASEDAQFGNPVLRMTPAAGEILMEPWDLGPRMAKEILWTGDNIDAMEAWRLGLVNKVVPRDQLEGEVLRLARRIALTPPISVELTKRSINRMQEIMGLTNHLDYHFLIHQISHSTEEAAENMRQMREAVAKGNLKAFLDERDAAYQQ